MEDLIKETPPDAKASTPIPYSSPGEVLDAPIGAEELKTAFELLNLVLSSTAAVTSIAAAIITLVMNANQQPANTREEPPMKEKSSRQKKETVIIRDPATGLDLITVTEETTVQEVISAIKRK